MAVRLRRAAAEIRISGRWPPQIAYGLKIRRNNMASCPFHNDRTPSMKVDKRFHCFGCGADGDVIDFVSRIFGISSLEAAQKIASDFGISYDVKSAVTKPKKIICRKTDAQIYAEAEQRCFRVLSDYYHLLKKWEIDYAPNIDDETCHPLFVEALQRKTHLEYLLDILVFGEIEEKALLVMEYGKEVASLEERISEFTCPDAEDGTGGSQ